MAISLGKRKGLAAKTAARARRQLRGRKKINGTAERPRMVVTRSARHLYVQVIDDTIGHTLCAASTLEEAAKGVEGHKVGAAHKVGELVAERAKALGIKAVVFDRGGNKYHGRVAAVAEGAREAGLTL